MQKKELFHPKYLPYVDGLRAVAVLSVVFFHAFSNLIPGGFIGVDVFFVISGYLISNIIFTSLKEASFSFLAFYKKRILRIFPALVFVLISCLVFGWIALFDFEYKVLGKHIFGASSFISNFIFFEEVGYFDIASELKSLLHLWSLSIEEQFYIVWPFVLWVGYRYKFNVFFLIFSLISCSFLAHVFLMPTNINAVFYQPQFRAWEFLMGAILARPDFLATKVNLKNRFFYSKFFLALNSLKTKNFFSLLGLVLIFIGLFTLSRSSFYPGWLALIFPVCGSFFILYAGQNAWFNRKILSNRILIWFGLISYPLYLWHWPILSLARITEGREIDNISKFSLIAISIALAAFTYYAIEKPIRFGKMQNLKASILVLMLILIGFAGFAVYNHDGYHKRFVMKPFENVIRADLLNPKYRSTGWYCDNTNTKGAYCIYDQKTKPDSILIGDSHSIPLYFGLQEIYAKKGKSLAVFGGAGGCPPLINVMSRDMGRPDKCINSITNAFDLILKDSSIKTVILVSRGPLYTSSKGYGDISTIKKWEINFVNNPTIKNPYKIFEEALDLTLNKLQDSGKEIVYVHNVPELGFDIKTCIISHPIRLNISPGTLEVCALQKIDFLKRNAQHRLVVDGVLKKYPNVKIVDLSDALCDDKFCYGKNDEFLYYRDDNHLNKNGAKFVVEKLKDKF